MKQRVERHFAGSSASAAATSIKSNQVLVSAVEPVQWNETHELKQAHILDSLLENHYAKEYPFPQSLRKPASDPNYYDALIRELEEAPDRSWFGGFIKKIKGSLRFS